MGFLERENRGEYVSVCLGLWNYKGFSRHTRDTLSLSKTLILAAHTHSESNIRRNWPCHPFYPFCSLFGKNLYCSIYLSFLFAHQKNQPFVLFYYIFILNRISILFSCHWSLITHTYYTFRYLTNRFVEFLYFVWLWETLYFVFNMHASQ